MAHDRQTFCNVFLKINCKKMNGKKPLSSKEIDKMLKESAQKQEELDMNLLKYDHDACKSIFIHLPKDALVPPECEEMRNFFKK